MLNVVHWYSTLISLLQWFHLKTLTSFQSMTSENLCEPSPILAPLSEILCEPRRLWRHGSRAPAVCHQPCGAAVCHWEHSMGVTKRRTAPASAAGVAFRDIGVQLAAKDVSLRSRAITNIIRCCWGVFCDRYAVFKCSNLLTYLLIWVNSYQFTLISDDDTYSACGMTKRQKADGSARMPRRCVSYKGNWTFP